jgi:hypothetical protein
MQGKEGLTATPSKSYFSPGLFPYLKGENRYLTDSVFLFLFSIAPYRTGTSTSFLIVKGIFKLCSVRLWNKSGSLRVERQIPVVDFNLTHKWIRIRSLFVLFPGLLIRIDFNLDPDPTF